MFTGPWILFSVKFLLRHCSALLLSSLPFPRGVTRVWGPLSCSDLCWATCLWVLALSYSSWLARSDVFLHGHYFVCVLLSSFFPVGGTTRNKVSAPTGSRVLSPGLSVFTSREGEAQMRPLRCGLGGSKAWAED